MNMRNALQNISHDTNIIYFSIGSAAHMRKISNYTCTLSDTYNQQYPLPIRNLRTVAPNVHTHIFLVDPSLEQPPFIVRNNTCNSRKHNSECLNCDSCYTSYGANWAVDAERANIYHNLADNITVYTYNENVTYPGDPFQSDLNENNWTNLLPVFDLLNQLAITYKWFVVIHDYSGRSLENLAAYYDSFLGYERDHIIYGLGIRDSSCYIDLADSVNMLIPSMTDDGEITVFNPFTTSYTTRQRYLNSPCVDDNTIMVKKQINKYTQYIIKTFRNNVLDVYRRTRLMHMGNDVKFSSNDFKYLETKYRTRVNKSLSLLTKLLLLELAEFSRLFGIDTAIMKQFVSDIAVCDPYDISGMWSERFGIK